MLVLGGLITVILWGLAGLVALAVLWFALGVRVIRSDRIGIQEKWWSPKGSLKDNIIALKGEAGYQPEVLRGGVHFRTPFMYRVHVMPLITIPQGKIGYVFARDGVPLAPAQTLGKVTDCNTFQDVRAFMANGGQRGPQRQILREGTYAFNLAQFVIITESHTFFLPMGNKAEEGSIMSMATRLQSLGGFDPVVIRGTDDKTGIVTVHDGPSLPMGDIIAPPVGETPEHPQYHNNFQDPEAFLAAGGFRGRQYQVLTEGTYFINRSFATVELVQKILVPVGFAGVVVSFYGVRGKDTSGEEYRHGELVDPGQRGVWNQPLMPGKYAFNTYAGTIILVPTTNIILKWISAEVGSHKYDENLAEVGLITKDAFEPSLPLSVVIHIDYRKAPLVIQRFGDIKMLVDQTLDPMVSSYFKNIGQTKTLIELIQQRADIQAQASQEMKDRFSHYNLELEEVLIGTPHSPTGDAKIQMILEQLRDRQVAVEKLETFDRQKIAADKERELKEAMAVAEQQTILTQSQINIDIQENQARADLQRAQQDAERVRTLAKADSDRVKTLASGDAEKVRVIADADAHKVEVMASADASRVKLMGEADAKRVAMLAKADAEKEARVGVGKAIAIDEQVRAYGGPQLQLIQDVMTKLATAIEASHVPIVPSTVVNMGGGADGEGDGGSSNNAFGLLMTMLATEKLTDITLAERPVDEAQAQMVAAIKTDLRETLSKSADESPAADMAPGAPAAATEI